MDVNKSCRWSRRFGDVYLEDIILDSRNAGGEEENGDESGSAVEGSSGATEVHR